MKIYQIAIVFLIIFNTIPAILICQESDSGQSAGIQFFQGSFEEAKILAKEEGKLIFVDAYAVWCGPCKRMAKVVFTDEAVGNIYNRLFVNLKIDMEKEQGKMFGQQYPVSAYPTLFYLDADGNVLEKIVGGRSVEDFIALGQKYADKVNTANTAFIKQYELGNRDPEVVFKYIQYLNKTGKNPLPVVNEYIKGKNQWKDEWDLKILYESAVEADSKVFELYLQKIKPLEKYYTKEELLEKIYQACLRTAAKAGEFEYPELLQKSKEYVKEHCPKLYKTFSLEADLIYAAEAASEDLYRKTLADYTKAFADNLEKIKKSAILSEKHFPNQKEITQAVIKSLETIVKKQPDSEAYFLLAKTSYRAGLRQEAKSYAEKAYDLAEQNKENTHPIRIFLMKFSGS